MRKVKLTFFLVVVTFFTVENHLHSQLLTFYPFNSTIDTMDMSPGIKGPYYSYVGEYRKALSLLELDPTVRREHPLNTIDSSYLKGFQAQLAKKYILKKADNKQIMIFNENHGNSRHRLFVKSILEELYDLGYRSLGLEGLSRFPPGNEENLNSRGYEIVNPKLPFIGYTAEPQFGELIREALSIGYYVYSYERVQGDFEGEVNPYSERMLLTKDIQARNIVRKIFDKDPDAKTILYCGWGHCIESEQQWSHNYGKSKWMASFLKDLTGINPYTVNQALLSERFKFSPNPFYSLLEEERENLPGEGRGEPLVFVNEKGQGFNPNSYFSVDLYVYHPSTKYINGRPDWLTYQENHEIYPLSGLEIGGTSFPLKVIAQVAGEEKMAIPVDVMEVRNEQELISKALVLKEGRKYRVSIFSMEGKLKDFEVDIN
ncbi:hypothetical protein [Membranihabitans maritimus]|uniref:hypothetical protein n=1 Tax=Membranihabitans maritimus TaxID=2904244 RepID=UPI001F2B5B28|nr:hypothetical protein [Membranihabitans maritimus]